MAAVSSDPGTNDAGIQSTFDDNVLRLCGGFELDVKWNGKQLLTIGPRELFHSRSSRPLLPSLSSKRMWHCQHFMKRRILDMEGRKCNSKCV